MAEQNELVRAAQENPLTGVFARVLAKAQQQALAGDLAGLEQTVLKQIEAMAAALGVAKTRLGPEKAKKLILGLACYGAAKVAAADGKLALEEHHILSRLFELWGVPGAERLAREVVLHPMLHNTFLTEAEALYAIGPEDAGQFWKLLFQLEAKEAFQTFFTEYISLLYTVAAIDGHIDQAELEYVKKLLGDWGLCLETLGRGIE